MKLNGNSRGGHTAPKNGGSHAEPRQRRDEPADELKNEAGRGGASAPPPRRPSGGQNAAGKKKGRAGKRAAAIVGSIVAVLALCVIVYALWEKPAEHNRPGLVRPGAESTAPESAAPGASATPEPTEDPNEGAPVSDNENMYTFLVVGFDQVAYHTDTIMVGALDTEEHTIDVVSIPRDTLMNISGGTKKINELVLRGRNNCDSSATEEEKMQAGMDRMLEGIRDLLGFDVDVYAAVDLEAFVELINAIGGVDYDVPVDMHYTDPAQGLVIDLDAGMQHLTGEQAVGVMRFRSGYVTADIGRIDTQQDFLMSIASQFLSLGSIPHLGEFINIFQEYVFTNMDTANLAFFARQFLMCKSENISFHTIPAETNDAIKGLSYVSIHISEWLDMVNEYLNPYSEPVTEANVNILTHSFTSGFYSTTGTIAGGVDSFTDYTYLRG